MTPNPSIPYILDFGAGNPLRLDLELPQAEITAHELVPVIHSITDAVVNFSCQTIEAQGKRVKCGPGCGNCCNQLVPISEYEAAHLANVVRTMQSPQRSRVISRFTSAIAKLEATGLLSTITDHFTHNAEDWRAANEIKKAYWELSIPCPFLEDNSCSIHAHRPATCRQYLVTSAPTHCSSLYSSDTSPDVVLHPIDVGGAFASFSGEGIQQSKILPLTLSLLAERGIRSRPASILPAPQMMGRFLDILANYFAR